MDEATVVKRSVNWKAFGILGGVVLALVLVPWVVSSYYIKFKQSAPAEAFAQVPASLESRPAPAVEKPAAVESWNLKPLDAAIARIISKHGTRFSVPEDASVPIMMQLVDAIPKSEFVDQISLYKTIKGLDGTTTVGGINRLNRLYIGKFYMLQGDVFKIQADRDYPVAGLSQFSVFGEVRLVGNLYVPVNVECDSAQIIPPFSMAPILGRITGFEVGISRGGDNIIVPQVRVVAIVRPSGCCGERESVIINYF